MLLVAVGLEIGVVHAVGQGGVADGEGAVFVFGGHTKPVAAVIRAHGFVVLPAAGKGRFMRVAKVHGEVLVGRALYAVVKPLFEIGGVVARQLQLHIGGVGDVDDVDIAAVKLGADFQHGCAFGEGKKTGLL